MTWHAYAHAMGGYSGWFTDQPRALDAAARQCGVATELAFGPPEAWPGWPAGRTFTPPQQAARIYSARPAGTAPESNQR